MSHFFSLVRVARDAMFRRETREEMQRLSALGAAYRDHCLMMKLFPQLQQRWESTDQLQRETDFLFRQRSEERGADGVQHKGDLSYYVVSREAPTPVERLLSVETRIFDPELQMEDRVQFQLRANPSVTRSRGDDRRPEDGKRRPHRDVLMLAKTQAKEDGIDANELMMDAAAEWMRKRAETCGLQLQPGTLFVDGYAQHRLSRRSMPPIRFSTVDYAGVARVSDPERLRRAMLEGVGRKRGFGCGLLLIRRVD